MDVHQILEATAKKLSPKHLNSNNVTVRRSVASKFPSENLSPNVVGARTSSKIRPLLLSNSVIGNQTESFTISSDECDFTSTCTEKLDSEIESIEKEIRRLTLRLEYLRLEKLKRISSKSAAALKRGRFVPAKFMDPMPPPSTGKPNPRKLDSRIANQKTPLARKAISLGPAEIYSATKLKKPVTRPEFTPVSRRKSCFYKIQEVDELKSSPKSGKTPSKLQSENSKMAVSDSEFKSSIAPKELFKESDKSVTAKKNVRFGRLVCSRYMSSNGGQALPDSSATNGSRKRSLLESDNKSNKKRISTQPETFQ